MEPKAPLTGGADAPDARPGFFTRHAWRTKWVELLGSMRFAISLLLFICIASLIGTVLAQNQPPTTYLDQFGPFWFEVFDQFSIWQVYSSAWFLTIMGFLVLSTSLCLLRNAPRMLRDMRSFREQVREGSLKAFPHHVHANTVLAVDEVVQRSQQWLGANGYRWRVRRQDGRADERANNGGVLIAAKKGSANRLGYFCAHSAIVMICLGGLLDSELPVRLQVWLAGKQPVTDNMLIAQVPESGRLAAGTWSFRGNIFLADGSQTRHGVVSTSSGVLVQPLPFLLKLERFYIDYYSTGMPSSFKSDVEVTDLQSNESFKQTIAVNEPLRYKGVTVYQSSFDDGGSKVSLQAYPLFGSNAAPPLALEGVIGQAVRLSLPGGHDAQTEQALNIDLTALRVFNIENLTANPDPQPRSVREHVAAVTGSAVAANNEHLRNIGPSVQYRMTDRSGQAHEFHQYMLPVTLDGQTVFLSGVRQTPSQEYRYMRIPADANNSLNEFLHLRAALQRPSARQAAAQQFAAHHATPEQRESLERATLGALESFARAGFNEMVERIPLAEREKVLGLAVPMIQLSLLALYDADRQARGLPALAREGQASEAAAQWIRLALLALANLPDWPSPVLLQLQSFDQVQASVFQVTRSPGTAVVYLGCLLLIVGVFAMFYIRDRRIWLWVKPATAGSQLEGSQITAAMATQKRTLDFTREFEQLRKAVGQLASA